MRNLGVVESVSCALRNLSVAEDMRTCRSLRAKALPQWAMLIAQHDSEPASYLARAYSLSLCDVFYTFEYKNGLDHYRFGRPDEQSDGAAVISLGPTLKAAVKFYV
eukprot:7376-Heterococcus_DN1.PRE.8